MKPLSSSIKNDWKRNFYQVSYIHHDMWRKINHNIENLVGHNIHRISEEMLDQIRDDCGVSFLFSNSSFLFFDRRDHTGFQHSPSFFMNWSE